MLKIHFWLVFTRKTLSRAFSLSGKKKLKLKSAEVRHLRIFSSILSFSRSLAQQKALTALSPPKLSRTCDRQNTRCRHFFVNETCNFSLRPHSLAKFYFYNIAWDANMCNRSNSESNVSRWFSYETEFTFCRCIFFFFFRVNAKNKIEFCIIWECFNFVRELWGSLIITIVLYF